MITGEAPAPAERFVWLAPAAKALALAGPCYGCQIWKLGDGYHRNGGTQLGGCFAVTTSWRVEPQGA